MDDVSRRSVLGAVTGLGLGVVGLQASTRGEAATGGDFDLANLSTSVNLNAVAHTAQGPFAVGNEGLILKRQSNGWATVTESGVQKRNNTLKDAAVSSDGRFLLVCGSDGIVGGYDTHKGVMHDLSEPNGLTNTLTSVSVIGESDYMIIGVADSSGNFVWGSFGCGCVASWSSLSKPTSGNAIYGVDYTETREGALVGSSGNTYETGDVGVNWEQSGVPNFGSSLYSVVTADSSDTVAVGSSGTVARRSGGSWSTTTITDNTLRSVSRNGSELLAAGGSGSIFEFVSGSWSEVQSGTSNQLRGVSTDESGGFPDVAVGKSGTAIERGQFTAEPKSITIGLGPDPSPPVDYELVVDGNISRSAEADAGDTVSGGTVMGTLSSSDDSDSFSFAGSITDFTVTSGAPDDVIVRVNGEFTSKERLKQTEWNSVPASEVPTSKTLRDVTNSSAGLFAVGGGGKILRRQGGNWTLLASSGPGGNGNNLYTVTTTKNGDRVWFGGSSGSLGYYDVEDGSINDQSAPGQVTNSIRCMNVLGTAGGEIVILGTGSGQIIRGAVSNGDGVWEDPYKPGSGSGFTGMEAVGADGMGDLGRDAESILCDSNGNVFRSRDQGRSWEQIGLPSVPGTPQAVTVARDQINLIGGSGYGFRKSAGVWTTFKLGGGNTRRAIDAQQDRQVVVGSSGEIYEREILSWNKTADLGSPTLYGVTIPANESELAVAVGSSGTIAYKTEL